jgi:hypothetical protein
MVTEHHICNLVQLSVTTGATMWGEITCLVLGSALVLGGLWGKKFHSGLSSGSQMPIPAWQGRTWIIAMGAIIVFTGLARMLGKSSSPSVVFVERAFTAFDFLYEFIGGIIAALVGLGFLLAGKARVDRMARLLGAAGLFFGIVLITDALWKMRR